MKSALIMNAPKNIKGIIDYAIEHQPPKKALVVYDTRYGLTNILTEGNTAWHFHIRGSLTLVLWAMKTGVHGVRTSKMLFKFSIKW